MAIYSGFTYEQILIFHSYVNLPEGLSRCTLEVGPVAKPVAKPVAPVAGDALRCVEGREASSLRAMELDGMLSGVAYE